MCISFDDSLPEARVCLWHAPVPGPGPPGPVRVGRGRGPLRPGRGGAAHPLRTAGAPPAQPGSRPTCQRPHRVGNRLPGHPFRHVLFPVDAEPGSGRWDFPVTSSPAPVPNNPPFVLGVF